MVRNADHKQDILNAASKASKDGTGTGTGNLEVLVESIEDVKSESDAKGILERVKADWVVWCAGEFLFFGGEREGARYLIGRVRDEMRGGGVKNKD